MFVRSVLVLPKLVLDAVKSAGMTITGIHAAWAEPTCEILRVLVFAAVVMLM